MPRLKNEIKLNEVFSKSKVIAITINDENMTDDELENTITDYQERFKIPVTNVLKYGCDNIIKKIYEVFPERLK